MDKSVKAVAAYAEESMSNQSDNPHFSDILSARVSRRQALLGGLSATTAAVFSSFGLSGCSDDDDDPAPQTPNLGFDAVAKGVQDFVAIPAGYSAAVLYALGDPMKAGVAAYTNTGADGDFDKRAGDHHDGMYFFPLNTANEVDYSVSDRGVLCINHENITESYLHVAGPTEIDGVRPEAEVLKEMNAHGISVIEVRKNSGVWEVVQDSALNRRITPFTEMEIRGPLRGSDLAKTKFSPDGTKTRGTINNCASGYTPWGTYLTCEENWAFYFRRDDGDDASRSESENALLSRYGISPGAGGNYGWTTAARDDIQRLNITVSAATAAGDYRNEAFTYGYIVEVDPTNPSSAPRKRTALGRKGNEGCWPGPVRSGQPIVFYIGDDSRNEYIYKFVSAQNWDPADANGGLAAGDKYMDDGTLYVAKFNEDGTGTWIPLGNSADVVAGTRLAADIAGATKMDRPEWGAVNPLNGDVYMTLTNSSSGSSGRGQGGSGSQPVDAANPRSYNAGTGEPDGSNGNVNGHIIRWREDGGNVTATTFTWDIYLFGARSIYPEVTNVSGLTATNDFSSPDGAWFDDSGVLWIQTDDGAYTDTTNCMMLAAVPGAVGDGGETTIDGQTTYVGAAASGTNLRRFLVGPKECEITGITMTPDRKTMFVNVQHPGEDGDGAAPTSNWPAASRDAAAVGAAGTRPRSATIVITRDDGGEIGV